MKTETYRSLLSITFCVLLLFLLTAKAQHSHFRSMTMES